MADKNITSRANPTVKKIRSLSQKKYRDEENLFLVEGQRHITDAIKAGWMPEIVATTSAATATGIEGRENLTVSPDIMQFMTGRENAQDVLAAFRPRWASLADVAAGLWVGLEEIRDPGNLGTIIRTCDAAGAVGVILIGNTCDPWSPETIRATMGSFARIKLCRATGDEITAWRKAWPGKIIGTHLRNAVDYRTLDYAQPLVLLMGSEQNGLSDRLLKLCDATAKIPMAGGAESLNLGIAAGIMLFEARRHIP